MQKVTKILICVLMMSLFYSTAALAQCKVDEPGMHRTFQQDPNVDLDDYGRIFVDADDPNCAQHAHDALYAKIYDSLNNYPNLLPHPVYQQWLAGYKVSLAFAAAERIGRNGWASQALDDQLTGIESTFVPESRKPLPGGEVPCSNESLLTCMDSDSGAAAAYAWMAAYDYRRGRDKTNNANAAAAFINQSMADVCIQNPMAFASGDHLTLCNGDWNDLASGASITMGVNHGYEDIPYGFGLMTGLASARLGLGAAGVSFNPSAEDVAVAKALFDEIERHVDNGSFTLDCAFPARSQVDGTWSINYDADCGDSGFHYTPDMYALLPFYTTWGLSAPTFGTYTSNYPGGVFHLGSDDFAGSCVGCFFSFGRFTFYQSVAYHWTVASPDFMPFNYYAPIGYLEQISSTGVAQGWSCDQDQPDGRVIVDFHDANGHVAEGFANLTSEAAINQLCGAGATAHRFSVQLPSNMADSNIQAFGLDYTGIGSTQLTCLQTPQCSFASCTTASFSAQPVSSPGTITTGASSTLTVGVSGTSPNIQWYTSSNVNVGSGSSITVSPTTSTAYYVTVSNACTSTITSNYAVVNVCDTASITSQPVSNPGTIVVGSSANLSIVASGTSPNIQWYTSSGVNVGSGSNISVSPTTNTTYYATVGNFCTSPITSATVTVTVTCTTATISSQPVSNPGSITLGASATLTIGVNGTSPNVQWYTSSGTNVGSGLSITVSPTATTTYHATINNFCTSAFNSANVTVSVCVPAGISSQPTSSPSLIITAGGSSTLSIGVTGTSTTVQWYTSTGTFVGSGTSISVSPTVKTFYYAVVSNACGSVQSSQVMVNVCVVATLGSNPTATPSTITAGQTSRLEMAGDSTGTGPFTYLWFKSDGTQVGTSTNKRLTVSPTVTTSYYYKVSNACGTSSASGNVTVTVN